jgi:hypothetical protein
MQTARIAQLEQRADALFVFASVMAKTLLGRGAAPGDARGDSTTDDMRISNQLEKSN